MDYDFGSINDKEFEALVADALSVELGLRIERFKPGRDEGVDGRFFAAPDSEVIIQCKHWLKSGLPALMREIKKRESAKIDRLSPARYIFVTSLPLSRADKKKIKTIFSPHIICESDILGNEDINDLLSRHPEVETRHYKLWMTSTSVLKAVFSAAIVGRSRYKLDEIAEESSLYVRTRSHSEAIEKLENIHSIIITGAPGIGKTTLANQICREYAANGFELVYIENSLNEAEQYYDDTRNQLFYFDDFSGRNFILALDRHEDSHIINFIRRVEKDPKKRFILTSRTTILNQGKRLSELFDIGDIKRNEYELRLAFLSKYDKAQILYNHIWFSRLEDGYIDQLYLDKRYLKIIQHENFNPRLISFITNSYRLSDVSPSEYWAYISSTLDNPKDIWGNVFEQQIEKIGVYIVIAVALNGKSLTEIEIKALFKNLQRSSFFSDIEIQTFDRLMRLLVGALLNKTYSGAIREVKYDLFNPSIADFVMANYLGDVEYVLELFACLKTVDSLSNIKSLLISEVVDENYCAEILIGVSDKIESGEIKVDEYYLLNLLYLIITILDSKEIPLEQIKNQFDSIRLRLSAFSGEMFYVVLIWAIEHRLIASTDPLIKSCISSNLEEPLTVNDYITLSRLVSLLEPSGGPLSISFKGNYIETMAQEITIAVIEANILYDYFGTDYRGSAEEEVENYVQQCVDELSLEFYDDEIVEIAAGCDFSDIAQSNIASSRHEDMQYEEWKDTQYERVSEVSAIDDLFDRG